MLEIFNDKDFRKVAVIFVVYKAFVIAVALGAQAMIPGDITNTERVTDNAFLNPFAQYDTTAYLYIAENGYTADFGAYHKPNYHWYPLYPALIKIFGFVGHDLAAFLVSNIASFFAVAFVYLLTKETVKGSKPIRTAFYFLFFPTAYYLTVMYTEPLFIALTAGTFYFASRDKWAAAGAFGLLSALTRAQGLLLFPAIAYMYARHVGLDFRKPDLRKINRRVLCVFLIPLGTFVFAAYEYFITGDFFAQFRSLEIQGVARGGLPWDGFVYSLNAIFLDTTFINVAYHVFNIFLMAAFIVLAYLSWKKLPKEYTIYFALNMALLLFAKTFYGAPRYLFVIFPAFMLLPLLEENKKMKYLLLALYALFILMSIGFIALHVTERFNSPLLYTPLF